MIFTKRYLDEQVQKNVLLEYSALDKRTERPEYDVFISYNKIINEVHLLGLTFSDEKVECSSKIFSGEYFR